jgi:UDP-N-acetyl-D-glucosamine dehydrogenase
VGPATASCGAPAAWLLGRIASSVHLVSSPEAAELTKLYENTFRAVNIAFANEMAGVARRFGLDPVEVTDAAATKPYGFMPFYPGSGVGGHCIPCDPHYLLQGLRERRGEAPIVEQSMEAIARRPGKVAMRAARILAEDAKPGIPPRVLVVGAAYKPGVMDVRESPALEILSTLQRLGAAVSFHDPLVKVLELSPDLTLLSVSKPKPSDYDLVVVVTVHPGADYSWLTECRQVLDCTYRTPGGRRRHVL